MTARATFVNGLGVPFNAPCALLQSGKQHDI
jgi:hypothetical protein